MLILNHKTVAEVLSFDEVLVSVEQAMLLYDQENYMMPDRLHLDMEDNTLLLMPCMSGDYFGTKLVSFFPDNQSKQLPSIMGAMMLNDGKTGKPLALLDAPALTALRTGAVGGVAIRYLAGENDSSLGVLGMGVQGLHQAYFACTVREISTIFLLNRNAEKLNAFIVRINEKFPEIEIKICDSVEHLVKNSQIIITATNASDPVLPDDASLLKGKTFIAVGSFKPSMREMPDALYPLLNTIYVDTILSKKESGDVFFPLERGLIRDDQIKTLGQRIAQKQKPQGGTNLFKSVGMALFDLVTGCAVFDRAKALGLGIEVEL